MGAYLFVHFVGTESTPEHEQIYFSVSKDGQSWQILNGGKNILTSDVGELGVRDPYIIRSVDGSKFYLVATDLSIYQRMQFEDGKDAWRQCTYAVPNNPHPGSKGMVIWESEDLVHWSRARLVQTAPAAAGCFWAPKCIWDKEKAAYMVVGASKMPEDGYKWLRLYRTYTLDFRKFTEPELYIDLSLNRPEDKKRHVFDCVLTECDGRYYRIYKSDCIQMDVADSLSGDWQPVDTNIHLLAPNHEGPAICREGGKKTWMLMLDCLTTHGGYQPFYIEDMQSGQFIENADRVHFPSDVKYRHGSILAISHEEYERLITSFTVK